MAGQKSRDMLLKIGDGASPEVFTTIGALRSKNLTLGGQSIDVTADDSLSAETGATAKLVRELIAGGVQSLDVSGDFVLKELAYEATLVSTKMGDSPIANWQIVVPTLGTFAGAFDLTTLELAGGDPGGEVTGSLSLASAGDFSFTAA